MVSVASALGEARGRGGDGPPRQSPGEELRNWSSLIGIITAIVGNVLIALALNVQRYAHIRLHMAKRRIKDSAKAAERRAKLAGSRAYGTIGANGSDSSGLSQAGDGHDEVGGGTAFPESEPLVGRVQHQDPSVTSSDPGGEEAKGLPSSYLKSPYWWLGQVLITLGEMGNFLAYGFAPASIVSPLGVVALISNCVIAPILFHEKFRQRDFWGVVVAVGGVVTVVLSANQEETKLAPHDVWDGITTLEFEIYLGVTVGLIAVLMYFSGRYGSRTILIDLGLVGLFGGYTALATKGVSSMLSSTLFRAFTTPVTYVLILVLLGTAIMQIRYVNRALQRFDSTEVIPIQFVMFTLCVITGSAVLYRDFERTTSTQAVKFVGGCLLTFFGVFLITSDRPPKDDGDALSDMDGIEETINLSHHDPSRSAIAENASPGFTASRRSSRSSRSSRLNFDAFMKPFSIQHDTGVPSLRLPPGQSPKPSPDTESRPLLSNPWPHLPEDVDAAQGGRTISSETIQSRVSRDSIAPLANDPVPSVPSTPRNNANNAHHPADFQTPVRLSVRSHNRHLNGPIISPSPFSSTVSAVVKDTLRKHTDNPLMHKSSLGRIRSSIRASLFLSDDDQDSDGASMAREPLFGALTDGEDVIVRTDHMPPNDGRRRARSLSDALGEFFRIKRRRRDYDDDVENGGYDSEDGSASD